MISSTWDRASTPEGAEHDEADVLELVSYRPCTAEDVAHGLGMHPDAAVKYLAHLLSEAKLRTEERDGKLFYLRADRDEPTR